MPGASRKTAAPRVLYLPNEGDLRDGFGQVGGRAAFNEMAADGTIGELKIYSFLAEYIADGRNREKSHRALLEMAHSFQPGIIFWQHPIGYPIPQELIDQLRSCGSSPLLAYHEGDPFDRFYKLMPAEVMTLYRNSDVFFTIGLGEARRKFNRIRMHPNFYHSPHCFDRERVGTEPPSPETLGSKYDAVMIGTIGSRIRGLYRQPYAGQRILLASELSRLFGDRFATFGGGWPAGTNNLGPIPYATQAATIQSSRMSVIWELYPEYTFYFSDRLPIALASGVPFVTNRRSGYDAMFADVKGIYQGDTIEDLLDIAIYLRGLPIDEIASIGAAGRAWAFANLEARVVFRKALDVCLRIWRSEP